ncbi:MAG: UvrD-helicase domain-containing protein [Parachlamydiaceae bacterium]
MTARNADLFSGLNPEQCAAVKTVDGRLLILAGAGSGKTRVLTLRMAYLINHLNCDPRSILGLTFTNKAATEMRHRLGGMVDPKAVKQVTLSTFHSFCMQVLRAEIHSLGYTGKFTLYDEKDMQRLINAIARDLLEHEGQAMPSLQSTLDVISFAKNKGLQANEIEGTGSTWHDEFSKTVYDRLKSSMRAYNAVDFDSLLTLTVELFEKFPDILARYQERYLYLMIDEYQDTNPIQYRLAMLLASKNNNLCVVGDDDQSIYGWRGADIQNILNFKDAKIIKLEQNYRSTNTILKAANTVVSNNTKRHGKSLWSSRGEGELIEVFHAPTELDEAQAVVCRIDKMREKHGLLWKDIAILYRSNALSRPIEQALLKHKWKNGNAWVQGIPYQIFGGTEFYERKEVKDLMAYLRVIVNPLDQEALLRVINHPRRGVGDHALDLLTSYNRSEGMSLWSVIQDVDSEEHVLKGKISAQATRGIRNFIDIIQAAEKHFTSSSLRDAMLWLVEKVQYKKAIEEEVKSEQMRAFKWENVQEFISSMANFPSGSETVSLEDFVLQMPLSSDFNGRLNQSDTEDKVSLMTFHSAKGLEFPACFLVGMEDHIIPHEKSVKETGVEEERRLMYVAMTRAMKFLTISMARKRMRMGVESASSPSRFIKEIPKELLYVSEWHSF